ncbi:MAG: hypothetical protein CL503_06020 [Actinobacteria bacterium]|nr:hypothetical protein [Actinomycetota bacterium]
MTFTNKKKLLLGSHRGLTTQNNQPHPANTIASFEAEAQSHADYIECDCIMTKDNKLLLFHDPIISNHPVTEQYIESLQKHHPSLESLDQLLTTFVPNSQSVLSQKGLCLELKFYETTQSRKKIFAKKTLEYLDKYKLQDQTVIVSFDPEILSYIYDLNPNYALGLNLILDPQYQETHKLPKPSLSEPIIEKLSYCCPHINNYDHPKLPKLPKLIWESKNENLIYQTLKKIQKTESIKQWSINHNISGITTNSVQEIAKLLPHISQD